MKSRFWRAAAAAAAIALAAPGGQAMAHGRHHYHGGHYRGGWWVGGAALVGAGVALALGSGPRHGYRGMTYVPPPVFYYPPVRYAEPVYAAPPVVHPARVAASGLGVIAYPAKGQSEAQQARDRQECRRWAMNHSGVDPDSISEYTTGVSIESYNRAMGACFKGRGYSIN